MGWGKDLDERSVVWPWAWGRLWGVMGREEVRGWGFWPVLGGGSTFCRGEEEGSLMEGVQSLRSHGPLRGMQSAAGREPGVQGSRELSVLGAVGAPSSGGWESQ